MSSPTTETLRVRTGNKPLPGMPQGESIATENVISTNANPIVAPKAKPALAPKPILSSSNLNNGESKPAIAQKPQTAMSPSTVSSPAISVPAAPYSPKEPSTVTSSSASTPTASSPTNTVLTPDSVMSIEQLLPTKITARALWTSSDPSHNEELCFKEGEILTILNNADPDWWKAELNGSIGWIPAAYVKLLEPTGPIDVSSSNTTTTNNATPQPNLTVRPARALWTSQPEHPEELFFREGDVLNVLSTEGEHWWEAEHDGIIGWIPAKFVRLLDDDKQELPGLDLQEEPKKLSDAELCVRVINEIISTERDYIRNLNLVIEGYKRKMAVLDGISKSDVDCLFSNIEEIHAFQCNFEQKMSAAINQNPVRLGQVFLQEKEKMRIYAEYCVNHPKATAALEDLQKKDPKLKAFFLGCRLLIEQDIALEGFLLTPIQRLCKYPLLLRELLKYTPPSHVDYKDIEAALVQMKEVASFVNEMQRQKDNLKLLAELQTRIEGWEGDNLADSNTELLLEATLTKVSKGKSQERRFFLFDKTLVYSKENPLKKKTYQFKGRIQLEKLNVMVIPDGTVPLGNNKTANNAWTITRYDLVAPKVYLVCTESPEERDKWINTIERAQTKLDFVVSREPKPQAKPPRPAVHPKPRSLVPAGAIPLPMLGAGNLANITKESTSDGAGSSVQQAASTGWRDRSASSSVLSSQIAQGTLGRRDRSQTASVASNEERRVSPVAVFPMPSHERRPSKDPQSISPPNGSAAAPEKPSPPSIGSIGRSSSILDSIKAASSNNFEKLKLLSRGKKTTSEDLTGTFVAPQRPTSAPSYPSFAPPLATPPASINTNSLNNSSSSLGQASGQMFSPQPRDKPSSAFDNILKEMQAKRDS